MPPPPTSTRIEPVRTRKTSKKEQQKSSSSDIKEAFKMAAAKAEVSAKLSKKASAAAPEGTTLSPTTDEQEELNKQWCHNDVGTQVASHEIALELGLETTSKEHVIVDEHGKTDASCTIDIEKQEMLEAIQELTVKYNKLDDVVNHPKSGTGAKLVNLTLRADTLYSSIHGAASGILVQLSKMQQDFEDLKNSQKLMEQNQARFTSMMAENKRLASDLLMAQGLIQKYSQKINALENKVLDLTRRSMEQNLIIHGIEESKDEDCYDAVEAFIFEHFEFKIDEADVWRAFRLGVPRNNKARPMFVKFSFYARDRIMDNVSVLKNKKNVHNQTLFVSNQVPEGITESRKALIKRASNIKEVEKEKPLGQRREVKIMGEHVVVGGEVVKPEITTPQPFELFPGMDEQKKINAMNQKVVETQPSYKLNSSFVGLAVKIKTVQETKQAYKAVMQRFPYMDHVMMAYQFKEGDQIKFGSCDDTEYGGGSVIAKFIQSKKLRNIAVFVVRRYGGIHLGYDRFQAIEKAAAAAVQLLRPDTALPSSAPKGQQIQAKEGGGEQA